MIEAASVEGREELRNTILRDIAREAGGTALRAIASELLAKSGSSVGDAGWKISETTPSLSQVREIKATLEIRDRRYEARLTIGDEKKNSRFAKAEIRTNGFVVREASKTDVADDIVIRETVSMLADLAIVEEVKRKSKDDADQALFDALDKNYSANVVRGHRAWWCIRYGKGWRLRSLYAGCPFWPSGTAMHADGTLPSGRGIHAYRTAEPVLDFAKYMVGSEPDEEHSIVYGIVALAGNIVEQKDGYRAAMAYPEHVIAGDTETAEGIARSYGCRTSVAKE